MLERHRIDADFIRGGQVRVALNRAQALRLRERVTRSRELGLGERDLRALDAAELEQRVRVAGARCATFSPHAARVHPGKLLAGLAGVVQDLGVRIHEGTPAKPPRSFPG